MSRPGLIVGLGGTGQWVLTWLKRDLMLSNNGRLPANVKLLSIDTATLLEAGASRISAGGTREEGAEVGNVSLDKSEFIYIGGDSKPLAERVRQGKLKQIGQWYKAQQWLDTQSPATFILDDGAGRIRQFGRMAIFKDILGQEAGSVTWRAFRSAMEAIRGKTNEQRRLEIMVVGSFAGGTGSGMFLDVALILRLLAQQQGVHHVLRGFFALPSVFTNAPDRDMKARTFAAWRELNRFMVINSDFPMPPIEYVENNSTFSIQPRERIFDACYLVDGRRGGQPLAEESKFGVFPMMAEVISAILDDQAGTAYTQWIFTNLAPEYTKRPDIPMYSAVGAYTVQVPAHFVEEISRHQLGQQMLLSILQPRKDPDEFDRLIAQGAERHMALAAPDRNKEDLNTGGFRRRRTFLSDDATYAGQRGVSSLFLKRVANLNEQSEDQNTRAAVVSRLANASVKSADSWVAYFPDLGDDPTFAAIQTAVRNEMAYDVRKEYGRGEKEKRADFEARLRGLEDDLLRRTGSISASGEEYYGSTGDALVQVQEAQMVLFRRLLRLRLLDLLMGRSDNALIARSGKLGYAWDFFNGVVREYEIFLALLHDVQERRKADKPEIKMVGRFKQKEKQLAATKDKKLLFILEHPKEKSSEKEFLSAQQALVELRREDILHHYVAQTARQMKTAVEEVRDAIQTWIWHLSTGDDASGLPGLWDAVRESKQSIVNAHSYDTRTPKVQRLLEDQALPIDEAELAKALSRWEWRADYVGNPPRLHLTADILPEREGETAFQLDDPSRAPTDQRRLIMGTQNRDRVLELARRPFAGVVARTTVAEAIKEVFPDPKVFADSVANVSAEPLFDGAPGEVSPRRKSNLIRVRSDENDTYFSGSDGLQGELRDLHQLDRDIRDDTYGIQVVGSENPYKLTFVRTDDLYQYDHFSTWDECLQAYETHMDKSSRQLDPVLLQNFAAESRAVVFERRLTQEPYYRPYRPLHPRVVMLLEDPVALRQFLYLGMLGKIRPVNDGHTYRWQLTWNKSTGPQTIWLTRGWNQDLDESSRARPDIFNAIHGYVVMRRTQQSGRNDTIDTDFAQRVIETDLKAIGRQGEIDLIRQHLADNGLVGTLSSRAYDPDVPTRVAHEDYLDLSLVGRMMLEDRLLDLSRGMHFEGQDEGGAAMTDDNPFAIRPPAQAAAPVAPPVRPPATPEPPATTPDPAPAVMTEETNGSGNQTEWTPFGSPVEG